MKLSEIKNAVILWGIPSKEIIEELKDRGCLVVVPEQRPSLLGLKQVMPILAKEGISHLYCTDNVLGFLFYKKRLKKTYLGFNEERGSDISASSGSLYISLLSKIHNIEIKIFPSVKGSLQKSDEDASTLDKKDFILTDNKEDSIVRPRPEIIPQEVLN